MEIKKDKLKLITSPLVSFTGDRITSLGSIALSVTLGTSPL